jgi:predicted alpha/beta hydrolase family esterase
VAISAALIVTNLTYVFLAGASNSGPEHWERKWLDRVDKGVWVEHDDWEEPERDAWVSDLQKAVWKLRGPMVIVAHSLGCLITTEWANDRSDPAVRGAFLVAPPDPYGPAFPPGAGCFGESIAAKLGFPSLVVASRDDPYGTIDRAREVAETWGSEFVDLGSKGHINAASSLGDWDEGWAMLQRFVAGLSGSS